MKRAIMKHRVHCKVEQKSTGWYLISITPSVSVRPKDTFTIDLPSPLYEGEWDGFVCVREGVYGGGKKN